MRQNSFHPKTPKPLIKDMGTKISSVQKEISQELKNTFNFSRGQVMKLRERLELVSEDYTVTKAQLSSVFKCTEAEAIMLLKYFDITKTGRVDTYEFICGMILISQATLEEKAEMIFGLYDFDGNKFITKDELVIMLMSALAALRHMSQGTPPPTEDVEEVALNVMKSSDANNDKRISMYEFLSYITKNKLFLTFLKKFSLISKDDLRMNFGGEKEEIPDCDSDLEREVIWKGKRVTKKKNKIKFSHHITDADDNDEVKSPTSHELLFKSRFDAITKLSPSDYIPRGNESESPEANLTLEYIHGYQCDNTRNNLRYNKTSNIIYHVGSVGVVLNKSENSQRHFFEHTSSIVALAMHPNSVYVATGDVGRFPMICVWDSTTLECLARITGLLTDAISHLCFSSDGNYLAASAADDHHCIAIYDWDKCTMTAKNVANKSKKTNALALVATGQSTTAPILSLIFNPPGEQLIASCVNELNIITFVGGVIKVQKGEGEEDKFKQALLCAAFVGTILVTGTYHGQLLIWKGKKMSYSIDAHEGCVNVIWPRPNLAGIITGSNDSTIKIWDQSLVSLNKISLSGSLGTYGSLPKIRSVCESNEGHLLIGTRNGEIVEIIDDKPKVLMRSHSREQLWGLAIHPKKPEFATLGRDSVFSVWDINTRNQKCANRIDCGGNTVAFSINGVYGALGLLNGQIIIFKTDNYSVAAIRKDSCAVINIIKFSQNNEILAAAASDSYIYLYDVNHRFKMMKKIRSNNPITHMDFSEDSTLIQGNTDCKEIVYFDISTGKHLIGDAHDVMWASWNCIFGWPVQGIQDFTVPDYSINSVDRTADHKTMCVGDSSGTVRLYKYPCPVENSSCRVYAGHSSSVSNIKFTYNSNHVISIGANDRCIFQWKFSFDEKGEEAVDNIRVVKDVEKLIVDEPVSSKPTNADKSLSVEQIEKLKSLETDINKCKPEHYSLPSDSGGLPDANINIKYVHGYCSDCARDNIKWTKNGRVLYHAAALGIVIKPKNLKQSFFVQHERDIICLAIHPNGMMAATGELAAEGENAMIYIWNVETNDILACLTGFHKKAVRYLKFSPNGSKLLSIGEDNYHSFALYDWMNNKILASAKVDSGVVTACEFNFDNSFVTCGLLHIKFWTVDGYNILCYRGRIEKFSPFTAVTYAFPSKTCISGSADGSLIVWKNMEVERTILAHTGMIFVLIAKNNLLVSGGEDGILITWDANYNKIFEVDLSKADLTKIDSTKSDTTKPDTAKVKLCNPCIRAVDLNKVGEYIVGTKGSEIISFHRDDTRSKDDSLLISILVRGHYAGQLWGLCVAPNGNKFASCGGDCTLRLWNMDREALVKTKKKEGRAIDWSSNSNFIVIALSNGVIKTVNPSDYLNTISKMKSTFEEGQWIEDIKISPNNQLIAFGAHMGVSPVEVMKVNEQGSELQKFKVINIGLNSALTHLDWDTTSVNLVVNSAEYGVRYVSVPSGSVLPASPKFGQIEWYTWTCVLGYWVKGILSHYDNKININGACRSHGNKVLATGDYDSKVKLFKFPCLSTNPPCKSYIGHSSKVTKVRFFNEDKFLVSSGCNDKTIIVWTTDISGGEEKKEYPRDPGDTKTNEEVYNEIDDVEFLDEKSLQASGAKEEIKDKRSGKYFDIMTIHEIIDGVREPSGFTKPPINQSHAPKKQIKLDYVYGYRSRDVKNNINYLKDGSIAYHAASVGIVLDKECNKQKFFLSHRTAILSIAFHPDGIRVATGSGFQVKPTIYIWDSTTCSQIAKFNGDLEKGIRSLAYSPSGDYLAAIDMSDYHILAIYDANNAILLALSKIDPSLVLQVAFNAENSLITVGPKHYMFWKMSNKSLTSKKGKFNEKNQILGCLAAEKDLILTGNVLGHLYQWNEEKILSDSQIHTMPMDCITIAQQIILTGGRDGKVNILDKQIKPLMSIDMTEKEYNSLLPGIRALSLDRMGKKLLVGTADSKIFELIIEPASKIVEGKKLLMSGHCAPRRNSTNELWGLAVNSEAQFVTAGEDATLRIWDVNEHKQKMLLYLNDDEKQRELSKETLIPKNPENAKATCLDVTKDGTSAIIGFKDGKVKVFNIKEDVRNDYKQIFGCPVSVIKIHPKETHVAIGAETGEICVFLFPRMSEVKRYKRHTKKVTQIDWSVTGLVFHSNALDQCLYFWDVNKEDRVEKGSLLYRDEKWHSWTCVYGWPVQGIVYDKDVRFHSCIRSQHIEESDQILGTGDSEGIVRLYRYPVLKKDSDYLYHRGHSSGISCVRFMPDDNTLISIGSRDGCIFQWKII